MGINFPAPLMQLALAGVLTAAPTGATTPGLYTQIGGTPPSGIALGDIFSWSGSAAILNRTFSNAPSAITIGAATWNKVGGTWVPSGGITVQGVLTAAPVAGTVAGLYATLQPFGSVAAGDLVYLPGGAATGTRYLSFGNAPATIIAGGVTYSKTNPGFWVASSNEAYFVEVIASGPNATYQLPGGFVNDTCRYNTISDSYGGAGVWFDTVNHAFVTLRAGWWDVTASYDVFRGGTVEAALFLFKNNNLMSSTASFGAVKLQLKKQVYLSINDSLRVANSGGAASTRSQFSDYSYFQARWIGN
jgi:hypothetical protein